MAATILAVVLVIAVTDYEYQALTAVHRAVVNWNGIQTDRSGNSAWLVEIQNKGNVPIVRISLVQVNADFGAGNQVSSTFYGLISENNTPPNPFMLESSPIPCCTYGVIFSPVLLSPVSKSTPLGPDQLAATQLATVNPSNSEFFKDCGAVAACTAMFQITYPDGFNSTIVSPISVHSP